MQPASKTLIMILGMHRSGTSVVTRCCNLLGIPLGEAFIASNEYNQKGFWEHSDVVSIHEAMLARLGYGWDDVRAMPALEKFFEVATHEVTQLENIIASELEHQQLWAVKDPRTCRLLPVWNHIAAKQKLETKAIIVFRNPLETALSLKKRDDMEQNRALLLWLRYNIELEYHTRNIPRSISSYPDLMCNTEAAMQHISKHINIDWPKHNEETMARLQGFIDATLKHNHVDDEVLLSDSSVLSLVKDCYTLLQKNIYHPGDYHHDFDAIRNELNAISTGFDAAISAETTKNSAIYTGYASFQENHKSVYQANKQLGDSLKTYQEAYTHFINVDKPKYEQDLEHWKQACDTKQREYEDLYHQHQHTKEALKYEQERNAQLVNSLSWKLTKPLRFIRNMMLMSPLKAKNET